MSINSASGLITLGATNDLQVGVFTIAVRATDLAGAQGNQSFVLTVTNVEENPVLNALANDSATEDSAYSRTIVATDPDPGATITYSLSSAPSDTISSKLRMAGTLSMFAIKTVCLLRSSRYVRSSGSSVFGSRSASCSRWPFSGR